MISLISFALCIVFACGILTDPRRQPNEFDDSGTALIGGLCYVFIWLYPPAYWSAAAALFLAYFFGYSWCGVAAQQSNQPKPSLTI